MKPTLVRGKRILLVEDEPQALSACRMLLEVDEHQVVESPDGLAALERFKPDEIDLVLTDFRMPRMDGGELTARIKEIAPSTPVVVLTAWPQDLQPCRTQPDLVVVKPYTFSELRQAIARLLG
jgi:CheY-like chemotaxis protein